MSTSTPSNRNALIAGGIAGTTVDLSLYPIDTLKTRLQSSSGFIASGGFRGVYRGVGSAVVGSAPGAALFFVTYEGVKDILARGGGLGGIRDKSGGGGGGGNRQSTPLHHIIAASLGETAACAVRVPTEVIKQRAQAGQHGGSSLSALRAIIFPSTPESGTSNTMSILRNLYRGYWITILREVPFTTIQFPLWEYLKRRATSNPALNRNLLPLTATNEISPAESALYGSVSGAVAAGVTTPLDVLKTRVMLSTKQGGQKMGDIVREILQEHGVRPFFAGIGPRVMWISAGGAIFLGSYQWAVNGLERRREAV